MMDALKMIDLQIFSFGLHFHHINLIIGLIFSFLFSFPGLWTPLNHTQKVDRNHHKLFDQQLVHCRHSDKEPPPRIHHIRACMHARLLFDMCSKIRMQRCPSGRIRTPVCRRSLSRSTTIVPPPLSPCRTVCQYRTVAAPSSRHPVGRGYHCCHIQMNTCPPDNSKRLPIPEGHHHSRRFGSLKIRRNHRHLC